LPRRPPCACCQHRSAFEITGDVHAYVLAADRDNTVRSYAAALRNFETVWKGMLPATVDTVARYLAEHASLYRTSTLRLHLAALARCHVDNGFADPTRSPLVHKVLRGIWSKHGMPQRHARPLQLDVLKTVSDWLLKAQSSASKHGRRTEELRRSRDRYELPAFSTLDRAAYAAREQSNEQYFNSIASKLGPQTKVMIDGLLKVESGAQTSAWHSLKREPRKPTNKEMQIYLQHIETLKRIVETLPKPEIPIPKMRRFRYLARALDAAEMAECKPNKRYALAVVFIRSQYSKSLDDAALLFIKMFARSSCSDTSATSTCAGSSTPRPTRASSSTIS
jgi:hypothetical protein